jgi:diguanylate cyclase (GGDEF)-like protein
MANQGTKQRVIQLLVFLAALPLPIVAYGLGVHVVIGGGPAHPQDYFSSQAVLIFAAFVVAGIGGFLIWSTAASLARTTEVEARLEHLDGTLADRLEESTPLMNSFTRMLATIERQTDEINQFAQRLDSAYRELESVNVRLQEASFTDEVTRLYNRRFFSVRLEEEIARARRFGHELSLVFLDLDGFKTINDELGHLAGDETLRGVAEVLLKNSRGIDVISRYGGDEFAALLVETPPSGAGLYAERLRDVLAMQSFSHSRQVTASFGTASLGEELRSADDLIRAADRALYTAKRAGKNRIAAHDAVGAERPTAPEVSVT